MDGIYRVTCYGASGGVGSGGGPGGQGGITYADVYLKAGTPLYVYVGGAGSCTYGGWNGGASLTTGYHRVAGGGGGATDVRLNANLNSRIVVAGGGGGSGAGCCSNSRGGAGGGLNGGTGSSDGSYAYGGGQDGPGAASTRSSDYDRYGSFGYGAAPYSCAGAGGGGWWGGNGCWSGGSGGGSSYILDYPGCSTAYRALQHNIRSLVIGPNNGAGYTWGMQQGGNSGHGRASIILITRK